MLAVLKCHCDIFKWLLWFKHNLGTTYQHSIPAHDLLGVPAVIVLVIPTPAIVSIIIHISQISQGEKALHFSRERCSVLAVQAADFVL